MNREKRILSDEEIDELVTAQADDDSAWGEPTRVRPETVAESPLPITSDPEILSGAKVFRGTRVPVAALFDNLADGLTLDEFAENFPTVTREQAVQVLQFLKHTLER
jgi:uncharacterized protein (DUF433 family)